MAHEDEDERDMRKIAIYDAQAHEGDADGNSSGRRRSHGT